MIKRQLIGLGIFLAFLTLVVYNFRIVRTSEGTFITQVQRSGWNNVGGYKYHVTMYTDWDNPNKPRRIILTKHTFFANNNTDQNFDYNVVYDQSKKDDSNYHAGDPIVIDLINKYVDALIDNW